MSVQTAADKSNATDSGLGLRDRVACLRDDFLSATPHVCGERSHLITEYWKRSDGEPITIRRAKAFDHILGNKEIAIYEDELIVGNQTKYRRGGLLYPEFATDWIEQELKILSSRETSKFEITDEDLITHLKITGGISPLVDKMVINRVIRNYFEDKQEEISDDELQQALTMRNIR